MRYLQGNYEKKGPPWSPWVPSHWRVVPLLAVGHESRIRNAGMAELNLLSLSYGRIIRKDIDTAEGLLPESFETYQIVQPTDVVFRFTDLQNDQRSLRSGLVTERGIITSAYLSFTPTGVNPRFFAYLMRGYDISKAFYGMGGGLRQSLKYEDVRRMPVLVPPPDDQRSIADFLDRETAQIDALVDIQQAFVNTLIERRRATVDAILASAPGIGNVPMRGLVTIQTGVTLGKIYGRDQDLGEYPYLRVANVQTGRVDTSDLATIELPTAVAEQSLLRPGDVLITEGGDRAALARGSLWNGEVSPCLHQNHIYALRPDPSKLLAEFLVYILEGSSARQYFESTRRQTTNLSATNSRLVRAFRFTLPPLHEQRRLVAEIDSVANRIDALTSRAQRLVGVARERRAALITAAVTGQIDVAAKMATAGV